MAFGTELQNIPLVWHSIQMIGGGVCGVTVHHKVKQSIFSLNDSLSHRVPYQHRKQMNYEGCVYGQALGVSGV
jgi:hypothetical protein